MRKAIVIAVVVLAVALVVVAKQVKRAAPSPAPPAQRQARQPDTPPPATTPEVAVPPTESTGADDEGGAPLPPARRSPEASQHPQPAAPDAADSAEAQPPAPAEPPAPAQQEASQQQKPKPLPGLTLDTCLKSGKPTLAEFGAGWCAQCKKMEPVLDEAAAKYRDKANIVYVDVNIYAEIARSYRVSLIPTQIFFDSRGREAARHVGYYPIEDIDRQLTSFGVTP